VAVVLIDRCT